MTRTYALLEVSPEVYAEVSSKLEAAGYGHAFHESDGRVVVDMDGIALAPVEPEKFDDLALESRAQVVYEREVSVVPVDEAREAVGAAIGSAYPRRDLIDRVPGWYAVVDAEGDLVCLVPPGGAVDEKHREIIDARARVVADVLNRAGGK